jgi:hypothetical protein
MALLSFFTTGQGVLLLGLMAAAVVLLWDWRVALGALFVIQLGVAALVVGIEGVPAQTMVVQVLVIGLCCLMLATSGVQVHLARSGRQSGGWFFRLLVLSLLAIALESLEFRFILPEIAPAITRIFGWIALIALLMLSLGDNPLFTSVALLIWSVLGQAIAAIYVPIPEIAVAIGLVELALGLACSYLVVAEGLPRVRRVRASAFGPAPINGIHVPAPAGAPVPLPAAPQSIPVVASIPPAALETAPTPSRPALPAPAGPGPARPLPAADDTVQTAEGSARGQSGA